MKRATKRLIDSVWTLEFEILENGKAFIHNISRNIAEGYEQEKELNRYDLEEINGRVVNGFYLEPYENFKCWATNNGQYFEVENKQHIFSYGKN